MVSYIYHVYPGLCRLEEHIMHVKGYFGNLFHDICSTA